MGKNPFSAGRWVCGEQFFGRTDLLRELMHTDEPCNWVIGKRRMGKTSLLRELERRVNVPGSERLALFWDLQGSYDASGLFDSLYDAVEDSRDGYPDAWETLDFEPEDDGNSAQLLKRLARATNRAGLRLMLLMDETEELMTVGKHDPGLLSKLRRFMQTKGNTQTVMVSSPRLEQLGSSVETETSPFLHGFYVFYLGNLTRAETHALLRTGIEDQAVIDRITKLARGNPFETQLIAKHYFEEGDLDATLLELETNPTLNQTIEVNYNLLSEDEREILATVCCSPAQLQDFEKAITSKLSRMGYLDTDRESHHVISSFFSEKWLASKVMGEGNRTTAIETEPGGAVVLEPANARAMLCQVVAVYRKLLELAQNGQRIARVDGRFLTSEDDRIVLEADALNLVASDNAFPPWWWAIEGVAGLLADHVPRDAAWSVFRLHQMVARGPGHYTEKELLDLMMLIAEEAALD